MAAAAVALPFALMFCVAEVATRILFRYNTPHTVRENSLHYEPSLFARHVLKPDQEVDLAAAWGGGEDQVSRRYSISSTGTRGRPFDRKKPPGTQRVVILGGSAVFDILAEEGEDWPRRVERILRRRGHARLEVINSGIPGHASFDSLGRLYTRIWIYEPDIVLLYNAWNDLKTFAQLSHEHPLLSLMTPYDPTSNPFLFPQSLLDRVLIHSQVYVKLRNRYLIWKFEPGLEGARSSGSSKGGYDPLALRQYKLNLQLFVDACRNIGAVPILVTQASLLLSAEELGEGTKIRYDYLRLAPSEASRAMREANQVMREVSAEKQVALLDLGPQLSRSQLLEDHVHLNEAGSDAISLAVADFLEAFVENRSSGPREPTRSSPASAASVSTPSRPRGKLADFRTQHESPLESPLRSRRRISGEGNR